MTKGFWMIDKRKEGEDKEKSNTHGKVRLVKTVV